MADIQVSELKQRLSELKPPHLIDVREALEYHTFNIGGDNIPLGLLPSRLEDLELDSNEEIVVICQRGIRSETAKRILTAAGFRHVRNLIGGLMAWKRQEL